MAHNPSFPQTAGLHALIRDYDLAVPPPAVRSEIVAGARKTTITGHSVLEQYPKRYLPVGLREQVRFALRYEPVDLAVYDQLFRKLDTAEFQAWISNEPNGIYARRAWYLFEALTGTSLDLPGLTSGKYIDLLDPTLHVTGPATYVRRQRVNNNLIGTTAYSPLIRRTAKLDASASGRLKEEAAAIVKGADPALLARAVNYLYTKETKSSFAIEGEEPNADRTERFVAALQSAGEFETGSKQEFVELQNAIVDKRYAQSDWRLDQNYVGSTQRDFREYVHFVCPKPEDVPDLMDGWMLMARRVEEQPGIDAVCAAAVEAFGFVYIHPFDDGNGRIHRFLVHHVLSKLDFTPKNIVLPVSASMLRDLARYDAVLNTVSKSIKPFIDYLLDDQGRMTVRNATASLYRYLDATAHCEYLYDCVQEAIETDLKDELGFLRFFDEALRRVMNVVDMPNKRASLLIRLIHQNGGKLAKGKRETFAELSDDEISKIEHVISEIG